MGNASDAWYEQGNNCERIDLADQWWRIPLYWLCSAAVLGQYRFPVLKWWRALIVMWIGYEVQYQSFDFFASLHDRDNIDTATSNVFGAGAAVVAACAISYYVNQLRYYSDARILQDEEDTSILGKFIYHMMACGVRIGGLIGLGRQSDVQRLRMEQKLEQAKRELRDPTHERKEIRLETAEENVIIETIVGSQDMNIWSILMPALYQLVPGTLYSLLFVSHILCSRIHDCQALVQLHFPAAFD